MRDNSEHYSKQWEALWLKYEPGIRSLCRMLLSSKQQEVDDVVMDTYLRLMEAVKNGTVIENPQAWLYSTAKNVIKGKYTEINMIKETQVSLSDSKNGKSFDIPYDVDMVDQIVSQKGVDLIYDEIMEEIGERDEKLLSLTCDENMKYRDAAKIFNSTEFAVKQRIYRLKRRIRKMAKEKTENFL